MTWDQEHTRSEALAAQAAETVRAGDALTAEQLYREAASAEANALIALPSDARKTRGITAVSAVALSYKGRDFATAETLAHKVLAAGGLPDFAQSQLKDLLSLIWTAASAEQAGIRFVSGDVLVSVKGGEVLHGGAPLDLIVREVEGIQAILYRTVEMLVGRPFRRRGAPSSEVQSMVRPWLFQAPAGSYQFAVRVQEPPQLELFAEDRPHIEQVTRTFFKVLQATASDPEHALPSVVEDEDYQRAFLGLARNLAPTGKVFERLEIRDAGSPAEPVAAFVPVSRQQLNTAIGRSKPEIAEEPRIIEGVLRALHLDQGWLEVTESGEPERHTKVEDTGDALDDVVGPMVNKRVRVTVIRRGEKNLYRDIEAEE